MSQSTAMSQQIVKGMEHFLKYSKPRRLNRNLRGLLLSMLQSAHKDDYRFNVDDLLYDLNYLFELLDTIEDD